MNARLKLVTFFAVAAVLVAGSAMAGPIIIYSGTDDGASIGGPWPNSTAAQTSFLAAAGPTSLINFENVSLGYYSPIVPAAGVSIALTGTNYGAGFSGISGSTFGNLYGFNTTAGGSQWLGFPSASATFSFSSPVSAFGFWITGVQSGFTSTFTLTFNDGADYTLNIPINGSGGAQYFGFTDLGGSTSAITITDLSIDAWGIDDVSYSSAPTIPEPASLLLFGSGLVGLRAWKRRRP